MLVKPHTLLFLGWGGEVEAAFLPDYGYIHVLPGKGCGCRAALIIGSWPVFMRDTQSYWIMMLERKKKRKENESE